MKNNPDKYKGFNIQSYWLSELPKIYDIWLNWFDQDEPCLTIAQIISWLIPKKKSDIKILDCACGTGNPSIALRKSGFNIISSDGSFKMLEKAIKNAQNLGINLNFVKKPILWSKLASSFKGQKFDVVICTGNSITHVSPERIDIVIKQISLIINSGGLCIIDVKRYNKKVKELYYENGKGWMEKNVRICTRCLANGKIARLITKLNYYGNNIPGRKYDIELDIEYENKKRESHVFPVWANTANMILKCISQSGITALPLLPTPTPNRWYYDFCIGIRR